MTLSRANKTYKRAKMALVRSPDPSNSSEYLPRQAFWPSFMTGQSKMWLSIFEQCDLVFDPRWPIFELDIEIIKTNFQTNFQDTCIKTVATRVLTFCFICLAHVTKFFIQDDPCSNTSEQLPRQTSRLSWW